MVHVPGDTEASPLKSTQKEIAPGRLFVVSGPSGVGKDAVLDRALVRVPGVVRSVSATTRAPRPGEADGVDYHFLSWAEFEKDIAQGFFLEYARYGDNLYGTPLTKVAEQRARDLDVVLKIEVQGAQTVKRLVPDAVLIFVQPPSFAELERRLHLRATDSKSRIAERLATARAEMDCISFYDYLITNDDLEAATEALCAIIIAERHRIPHGSSEPDID